MHTSLQVVAFLHFLKAALRVTAHDKVWGSEVVTETPVPVACVAVADVLVGADARVLVGADAGVLVGADADEVEEV